MFWVITAGSILLMWIGELISEYKIGNGISDFFAGIVSGLPAALRPLISNYNPATLPSYVIFAILAIVVIAGVIFVNEGERKSRFLTLNECGNENVWWRVKLFASES